MEYLNLNSFETKRSVTIDSLKTHFLPIQEGEGDPSPENVRPITGWNSIKIRKTGKNLAKIVGYSAQANNSSTDLRILTNNYGTTISTTEYVSGNDKLVITQTVQPDDYAVGSYRHGYVAIILDGLPYGKKYNFSFKVSDIVSNPLNATLDQINECSPGNTHYGPIITEDNHIIFKNRLFTRHGTIPNRCTIEIRNCGMSFTLSEFMITAVEDEDFTYEPYREEEVEVELPKTMYGGYVDIAKGELVQEWEVVSSTWGNIKSPSERDATTGYYIGRLRFNNFIELIHYSSAYGVITLCNTIGTIMWRLGDRTPEHYYSANDSTSGLCYISGDWNDDLEIQIAAKLLTPIHYTLPPETLKTIRGFNTIFSTTNDTIEVGYSELSPTSLLKRRRDIIASEPHLVTVETGNTEDSDVIASFKTNTALPIKSMVTNFEPKQEGEGDPSPENIRPITGLSELEIHNFPHLVQWNQWLQQISEENWNPYDANTISIAFSDGVVTSEWLVNSNGGYKTAVRDKALIPNPEGHIWYVSYMVRHHAQGIKHFGVEFAGGRQIRGIVTAEPDVWYQVSTTGSWYRGNNTYVYISNVSNGEGEIGLIVESKSPVYIDLTRMFGAGNEPTKEEFEAQCALNGIDLTTYNPYDEGTVIPWRTSVNEDQAYNIPLTLPNLITPEPKSITSYNVDFTVNEDGTVDYEGTPTNYVSFLIGYYYVKGGETITVTLCGDSINICFSGLKLIDSDGNDISFLESDTTIGFEGKKMCTIDLSNYPTAYKLVIYLKRYVNNVYMKGRCWVRVVEGTVDTGDEVFGGYIDLENNEFVKTWECVGLDSLIWGAFTADTETYPNATQIFRSTDLASDISAEAKNYRNGMTWYVSGLQSINGANVTSFSGRTSPAFDKDLSFVMAQSGSTGYLGVRADHIDNVRDLKYFLQGKKFVYPKEVPVHFPLSPTVIRTLKGTNNIYTNANGKSIIKYWTH